MSEATVSVPRKGNTPSQLNGGLNVSAGNELDSPPTFKKQMAVICILVCLLTLISWLLFYYGRQHKVVIDNRAVEMPDGQNYRSLAGALVAVNKSQLTKNDEVTTAPKADQPIKISFKFWPQADPSIAKAVEMMPRERILVKVLGPEFNLKFEAYDKMGEGQGAKDVTIRFGAQKDAMVRLVKLQNGLPDFLEEYPNQARERQAARQAAEEEQAAPAAAIDDVPAPPSFGE